MEKLAPGGTVLPLGRHLGGWRLICMAESLEAVSCHQAILAAQGRDLTNARNMLDADKGQGCCLRSRIKQSFLLMWGSVALGNIKLPKMPESRAG